jgi:hypothetical protein
LPPSIPYPTRSSQSNFHQLWTLCSTSLYLPDYIHDTLGFLFFENNK